MASIVDFSESSKNIQDNNSVELPEDSNINVFEFGNLILADLFPALNWFVNQIQDSFGGVVSVGDFSGNLSTISDTSGTVVSIVDIEEE